VRTIKTLGIATAMALALIAFAGAGAASANYFKAGVEPEAWNGGLSGKKHTLTLGSFPNFVCEKVAFSGETKAKTQTQLTVTPELDKCEHVTGASQTWTMNGCKFRFNQGGGTPLVGTMDIVGCEKPMEYKEYTQSSCTSTIGNQSGLGGVEYQNILVGGVPAVRIIAKLTGITYTSECKGPSSNGTYQGEWTVTGATIPGGVAAAAEVEAPPPGPFNKFAVEEAPATLAGATVGQTLGATAAFYFDESKLGIRCESTTYSGTASSLTQTSIVVTPKYHGCSYLSESAEKISIPDISVGGCSYEISAPGGFSVVGSTCASKPLTVSVSSCVYSVGPQAVSSKGLLYTNEGLGKSRKVKMSQPAGLTPGLTYTATGSGCYKAGTYSTGIYRGSGTFSATNSKGVAQGFWAE
jgi:hypothetical protein